MIEAGFWTDRMRPILRQQCLALGVRAHFERVENLVGDGTPDVNFAISGVAGTIENKYTDRHPVREATPVLGKGNGLRRSQVIWSYQRLRAGGRVFVLIGSPKDAWLIDLRGMSPREMMDLDYASAPRLREIGAWCASQSPRVGLPQALIADAPRRGCR